MGEEVRASLLEIKFVKETSADPRPISPFGKGGKGDFSATGRTNPPKSPCFQGGLQWRTVVKFLNGHRNIVWCFRSPFKNFTTARHWSPPVSRADVSRRQK